MANVAGKLVMRVLTVVLGIPIGIATKKLVARAWVALRPHDPAHDVKDRNAFWADTMGYAALAAAGSAGAKLLTRRGAEQTYRVLLGVEPPPPPPTKAQKRLAEAEENAGPAPD
jgi:hypothetical protein